MKKKSAPMPEPQKNNAIKARRSSKADAAPATPPASSAATDKPKRAPRKPLFDVAVDAAKKLFKSKPAAKKTAKSESETEVEAPTVVRRTYTRRKKSEALDIPPILLEGDAPSTVAASGPGEKYSLGATPPAQLSRYPMNARG